MQRSYQWLGLSTAPTQTKHGVVSFGQRFEQEREAGTRDVDLQQEPRGIRATEASVLLLVCLEERGWDQRAPVRHALSWEGILVCCFRGAGFR